MINQSFNTRETEHLPAAPRPQVRHDSVVEFITHSGNDLAASVIRNLAEGQIEGFSPLLLVGDTGTGKTRLIDLLVTETIRLRPETSITRIDANTLKLWVNDLRKLSVDHPASDMAFLRPSPDAEFDDWSHLRDHLRNVDILIIDDLDDIAGHLPSIDELQHAIQSLDYRGSAVVLSLRSIPKAGPQWPARFLSLIGGGLFVRISPPDEAARRRFILRWSASRSVTIPMATVDQIAAEPFDFSTLKGRLEQIRLKAKVQHKPITPDIVADVEAAAHKLVPPSPSPSIRDIARTVAKSYKVTLTALRGPDRHPGIVRPRHVAIWLAHHLSGQSNEKISAYFGNRDSATIRHAIRQIETRRIADLVLDEQLSTFKSQLVQPSIC